MSTVMVARIQELDLSTTFTSMKCRSYDLVEFDCGHAVLIEHDDANIECSLVGSETTCTACDDAG